MKNEDLTPEDFDRLLLWLDPNVGEAALEYELIRRDLIRLFTCNGCGCAAEQLADRVIDRVTVKLKRGEIAEPFVGSKHYYFLSFVSNVCHEYFRECRPREIPPFPQHSDDIEQEYDCLDRCMERLDTDKRWLVIEYYRFEKAAKIDHRRTLANGLKINLRALRLRVHRIREELKPCLEDCLQQTQVQ